MNKIDSLFQRKEKDILSIYYTAGFPNLNDTVPVLNELSANGVDMIELGIPFSDPLADGPTIQNASKIALDNGMSVKLLFKQLKDADLKNSETSVLLMGYLNPILQYGVEEFCKKASALGIAGVILPDLPIQEYLKHYKAIFDRYELKNIFLITPQTSDERIRYIDEHSSGFIYMVSSSSTTGVKSAIETEQENYFKRIQTMNLKNPIVIGFGISNAETFKKACQYANGAIIGSAFVKVLEGKTDSTQVVQEFIKEIID